MKLISTPISPHKKAAIISIVTNFFGIVPAESGKSLGFAYQTNQEKEKKEAEEKEASVKQQQQGPQAIHAGEVGGKSKS